MPFFRKKSTLRVPFATDIHSHLIPGIDDGADSLEESLEIIRAFQALGYKKIITTPHIMAGFYNNTPAAIRTGLHSLKEALRHASMEIEVEVAAEYYSDESLLDALEKKSELLTFGDGYLLFELPFINEPAFLEQAIFLMKTLGLKPVLAHPERYLFLHDRFERLREIVDKGCFMQMNLNSLTGYYSKKVKEFAEKMIDEKLVHFVGSDCHRLKHISVMREAVETKYFSKLSKLHLLNDELSAASR